MAGRRSRLRRSRGALGGGAGARRAGGAASDATNELIGREGVGALARSLDWLGSSKADLVGSHHVSWDADPCARGGYAYFDPSFPPVLRSWLAQPCGRIFFAGEHTSQA